MNVGYNSILVLVSVLVPILGAYASFDLVIKIRRKTGPQRRQLLGVAALAIGGSIWTMHFIGMLALKMPMEMRHDTLLTLVSAMVSILFTAVALSIVAVRPATNHNIIFAGTVMGIGIAIMHYVGMSGMRGLFTTTFVAGWVVLSVIIGIVASSMSIWLVMVPNMRGILRRSVSAIAMGLSIAGVHYAGMIGTSFTTTSGVSEATQPILNQYNLGIITALVTFALLAWVLLMLLPERTETIEERPVDHAPTRTQPLKTPAQPLDSVKASVSLDSKLVDTQANDSTQEYSSAKDENPVQASDRPKKVEASISSRIPVQKNNKTVFIDLERVASVSADGHYSIITTSDGEQHFCNRAFNKLIADIDLEELVRVHRSHAVNLKHVNSFQKKKDKAEVGVGISEHIVPVSRSHVGRLRNALSLVRN